MRFQGELHKDGRFWLAEVPVFDAMTQGRTRKEALNMISDWFVTVAGRKRFSVDIHPVGKGTFEVSSSNAYDGRVVVAKAAPEERPFARTSGATVGRKVPQCLCPI